MTKSREPIGHAKHVAEELNRAGHLIESFNPDQQGGETEQVLMMFESDGTPEVAWVVASGIYTEQLNQPYSLSLNLATDDTSAEPVRLLGQSCRLSLRRGAAFRQITGVVSQVREGSTHAQEVTTNIVVVPALEVLRHRTNARIFQNVTVPEILRVVLGEGLAPFRRSVELRLSRTYPTCEYRTQYNESDLDFCSRLMQEEGIAFRFDFEDDTVEKLVLFDDPGGHEELRTFHESLPPGVLPFSEYEGNVGGHEYVSSFHLMSELRPTKVITRHFDWTHPSMPFEHDSASVEPAPSAGAPPSGARLLPLGDVYEHDDRPLTFASYDGMAYSACDMDDQVRLRREAQAFDARLAEGDSTVTGMAPGHAFELLGHPVTDLDGRYLVLSVTHTFDASGASYQNRFQCIPAEVPFRLPRHLPKPRVPSIQTATVVGPAGEEIHTDEHGRIKVQFHWDRHGRGNDGSSCWLRVMQPWAGTGWGFVFIPRIGMEVMVAFTNGDPDQPVVVGSVYNGDNPPPYPLPAEKTKSTIKTRSSLGGGGFNELRFEDLTGCEEVFIHAQKDFNEVVLHDHNTLVYHDQTNTVTCCQTELIGINQLLTVGHDRTKVVVGSESTTVKGTRTEEVTGDETITLLSNRAVSITEDDTLTVDQNRSMTVNGGLTEHVVGVHQRTVDAVQNLVVGLSKSEEVGTVLMTTAGESITFVTGKSSIALHRDGTIRIEGEKIFVKGEQLVGTKGGKASLTLDNDQAKLKGPKVQIRGQSQIQLKASKITEN